jgi:hypothetical protein
MNLMWKIYCLKHIQKHHSFSWEGEGGSSPQPSPYNREGGRKKKYADELHPITV